MKIFSILILSVSCLTSCSGDDDKKSDTLKSNELYSSSIKDLTNIYISDSIQKNSGGIGFINEMVQIAIVLDNDKGVPHELDEEMYGYIIEGFDVDEQERYYFLSGSSPSILACFSKDKQIFRRTYSQFMGNSIHEYNHQLMVFDYKFNVNNLFVLNKNDGSIKTEYHKIIENNISSYNFLDSTLIVRAFNLQDNIGVDTELAYLEYNFAGDMIGSTSNIYKLPDNMVNLVDEKEFMGEWKDYLVFFEYTIDDAENIIYSFSLHDSSGKILATENYDSNLFGIPFYGLEGFPQEHRKLKNNNIYMLAREGNNAVVSILPLVKIFDVFN